MKKIQKMFIVLVYIIVFIIMLYRFFNLNDSMYNTEYILLLFSYIVCGIVFLFTVFKKNYYIFEPYTLVSLLYILIMVYRPCLDIYNGIYYRFGTYFMGGCKKTTIIFTLSFLAFSFAYNVTLNSKRKKSNDNIKIRHPKKLADYSVYYTKKVKVLCIILFLIGFIASILYYKTAGYNPLAVIRNINQADNTYLYDSNYKFLLKISYLMIMPWIIMCRFDKSKILKLITTLIIFTIFLIGGSRIILLTTFIAFIILPYISEEKGFKFKNGIILFLVLLLFCDIIAYTRIGVRTGKSIDFLKITEVVEITDVFDSELTIYQPLYCIVNKVPSVLPYQLGKGLIGYSIFSFFPRVLFPWKANFDIMAKSIGTVMNETAMKAGLAMPNIGEFYLEFGVLGCIVCMCLFGIICREMKQLYLDDKYSINGVVLYSILFPFLMQIVCRGYLAVQLNSLLFMVLPYFVLKYSTNKQ